MTWLHSDCVPSLYRCYIQHLRRTHTASNLTDCVCSLYEVYIISCMEQWLDSTYEFYIAVVQSSELTPCWMSAFSILARCSTKRRIHTFVISPSYTNSIVNLYREGPHSVRLESSGHECAPLCTWDVCSSCIEQCIAFILARSVSLYMCCI